MDKEKQRDALIEYMKMQQKKHRESYPAENYSRAPYSNDLVSFWRLGWFETFFTFKQFLNFFQKPRKQSNTENIVEPNTTPVLRSLSYRCASASNAAARVFNRQSNPAALVTQTNIVSANQLQHVTKTPVKRDNGLGKLIRLVSNFVQRIKPSNKGIMFALCIFVFLFDLV